MKNTNINWMRAALLLFAVLALSACGGSGGSEDFNVGQGSGGDGETPGPVAGRLAVSSDRATINQMQTARITVTAVSQSNVAQAGVEVAFGASAGILRVERSITNEFGEASAILNAQGVPPGTAITGGLGKPMCKS